MAWYNSLKDLGKDLGIGGHKVSNYGDLPWAERTALSFGSGMESAGKSLLGLVGLGDYAPSSFTDAKNQIKTDISQKGYSSGVNLDTLWKGSGPYKLYDSVFNDKGELDKSLPSSLEMGGGISGGGESNKFGDDLPGRLGMSTAQNSLGKAIAYQEDPALNDQNYNLNNFNF
jgi:hypothetical protein